MTIVLAVGYLISFFKEALLARFFGVSAEMDAYQVAITLPVNLFSIVTLSIQSVVIPIYSRILYQRSPEEARRYARTLIRLVALGATGLILLFAAGASPLTRLFAPGVSAETHALTVTLLRIVLPTILFSLLSYIYTGLLNVHRSFVLPALTLWCLNAGIATAILLLHHRFGIRSACIGQVAGALLQWLLLRTLARRYTTPSGIVQRLSLRDPDLIATGRQMVPVVWSTALAEVNAIVNRIVASLLFVGAIAALGYAAKLYSILLAFFTSAIATVVYPLYAEASARGDREQLRRRVNATLSAYTFFLLPVTLGLLCLKEEIVTIAFGRGAFGSEAIRLTQRILGCYAVGLLFLAFRETLTKLFYSQGNTRTPALNASIGMGINIALSLLLPLIFGVEGLAIAATTAAIYVALSLLHALKRQHRDLSLAPFVEDLKRLALPAALLLLLFVALHHCPTLSPLARLIAALGAGGALYLGGALLTRSAIAAQLLKMLFRTR